MITGNIFKNWNKICYIAHKKPNPDVDDYGHEINAYEEPKLYSMNIMPAKGYLDTLTYGEKITKMYKAIVPYEYKDEISEGDIAYLDGIKPEGEVEGTYGVSGNYVVDSVRPQNLSTAIYFKRREK